MPDQEQFSDILFPVRGVDLYQAFALQRPGTTPVGINVRAYEPSTQRGRGGARAGLVKYIPQQLPLTFNSTATRKIQHLNYIVDPTPAGLDDIDSTDSDAVDDPSDPGTGDTQDPNDHRVRWHVRRRKVRRGGWGRRPNRNTQRKKLRTFEQQASVVRFRPFGDESNASYTAGLAFPGNVKANSLLICALERDGQIDETDPTPTVSDTLGNTYTLLAHKFAGIFNDLMIYLFYTVNTHGPGANTVNFTVFPGAFTTLENNSQAILEYSGFAPSSPADSVSTNSGTTSAFDTGSVPVTLPLSPRNEMILAVFASYNINGQTFSASPYKIRSNPTPPQSPYSRIVVADHIDVDAAEDGIVTAGQNANWQGIGASFKPA